MCEDSTEVETCEDLPECGEGKYLWFINISRELFANFQRTNDLTRKKLGIKLVNVQCAHVHKICEECDCQDQFDQKIKLN